MRKNTRQSFTPPFVKLPHSVMTTLAWAHLSGNAAKLHLHLIKMFNGSNNGTLFLSERDAASAIGVARATAGKAFDELVDHGFIEATAVGHFHVKTRLATCWRLTHLPAAGKPPTNDYRQWPAEQNSRVQKLTRTGLENEPVAAIG